MYFFFFYPVGTDAPRQRLGLGTLLFVAVLLGSFSLRFLAPETYLELVYASFVPATGGLGPALLSVFLHGSWMHLIGNSLYLWIFGRQMESRLNVAFLYLIVIVGGVVGCYVQQAITDPATRGWITPIIGASGGVAALLGATMVRFHHQRVKVLWFLFAFLGGMTKAGVTHVPTIVAALGWFAFQVVYGLVAWGNGGASTAYGAHAGGFVAGVVLAIAFGFPVAARREVHLARGRQYFERGQWHAALGELDRHLSRVPGDLEARRMKARCQVVLGDAGEAARTYLELFRDIREGEDLEAIARIYREMRVYAIPSNLSESGLLKLAFRLHKGDLLPEASLAYFEVAANFPDGPKAELAQVRRAEIEWKLGNYEEALAEYERLSENYPESSWTDFIDGRIRSIRALTGRRAPGRLRPEDTRKWRAPLSAHPPTAASPRSSPDPSEG